MIEKRGSMTKTNFTKVDDALAKALFKMSIDKLLESTDSKKEDAQQIVLQVHTRMAKSIARRLNFFSKKDPVFYNKINYDKEQLRQILQKPHQFSEDDLKFLEKLMEKLEDFRRSEKYPDLDDETLIELERKKHINKRFNTNEKWLPLQ